MQGETKVSAKGGEGIDDHDLSEPPRDGKGRPPIQVMNRKRFAGKTSFATSSTLTGVIGVGLGVLQLAAAAACIVM